MITVMVVDDDAEVRARALRCLARPEIRLASAANGRLALQDAHRLKPDVVICDIDMPEMDGFELLSALRDDPELGKTLVMMLTSESSRDSMRLGMSLGADDYLTKPFTGEELVEAFEGLMRRRGRLDLVIDSAVRQQEAQLRRVFSHGLDGTPDDAGLLTVDVSPGAGNRTVTDGVLLHCDLRNFTDMAARLTSDEVVALLTEYGDVVGSHVREAGGHHVQFAGSRMTALFTHSPTLDRRARPRAEAAAQSMTAAAVAMSRWTTREFGDRGLPDAEIAVQLHALAGASPGWESTLAIGEPQGEGDAVHQRAVQNAHLAARAVKNALDEKLASLTDHRFMDGDAPLNLAGYRLVRRIGRGGMSSVYLGVRKTDGRLIALKVLEPRGEMETEQMLRFVREYTLLSRIDNPNVIGISDQGFSNEHAYIAMEYFENGDLRSRLHGPMVPDAAVKAMLQLAGAMEAIHALGIVHRDIKPENLMVRADGSLVLADFGIAKTVASSGAAQVLVTQQGSLMGSPSYVSPEQIAGHELTPSSDLYSAGVVFFELLTGTRPYQGANTLELLKMHARAPVPLLPEALARFQPLIDRLMAKRPAARHASAASLTRDLEALAL